VTAPYYRNGGVAIYHGDFRDVLPSISGDALVTDPPYGIGWSRGDWDDDPAEYSALMRSLVAESGQAVRNGWCFVFQAMLNCSKYHQWAPDGWRLFAACKNFAQILPTGIWHSWDPVVFWANGEAPTNKNKDEVTNRDYHVGNVAGHIQKQTPHPCRRPIDTMHHIVGIASLAGQTVIDPFMGSGTTLRAAKDMGRKAIGIEIEERYCEIAAKRLGQEVFDFREAKP
jgi:site-specific DNA-methyltransferase (adenine-specific)